MKNTFPLLFEGLIEWEYPDDPMQPRIAPNPREWLGRIAEQADELILKWHEDWPANACADCRRARDYALDGIQALVWKDTNAAMIAAFNAGRAIERAQRSFPIQAWLKYQNTKSNQTKEAGSKGGKSPKKKKFDDSSLRYIYRQASDEEKAGSLTLSDWCDRLKSNTGVSVSTKTMGKHLTDLGYPYKGKRN